MRIFKTSAKLTILRAGTLLCLGIFIIGSIAAGILQSTFTVDGTNDIKAQNGIYELKTSDFSDKSPVMLNGEWEYYPNIFVVDEYFNYDLLKNHTPQKVLFPIDNVSKASGPSTYRLTLRSEESLNDFAFYLENYNEDFAIYINGHRIPPMQGSSQQALLYTLSDYTFPVNFPLLAGETEIIVSANSDDNQSLFYQNPLILGPKGQVFDYVAQLWRDDTFLIGTILILVIIGLIFMLIRTEFDILFGITLFDTFLVMRILLGFNIATYFISQLFPALKISNVDFVGMQYVMFFVAGIFGCLLSQSIFDPEKKLPPWPIYVQIVFCAGGGLFTMLFFRRFAFFCVILLSIVLLVSFLIVTWHVYHCLKRQKPSLYIIFQTLKTYFIGLIMAIDILYLRGRAFNALVYAYALFLLAHLLTRLMDSNSSYREVASLNHNLEKIVAERTSELTEANRRLSELSIRDPLTQAHNRLYFENMLERVLKDSQNGQIYLCMFDLDFFKSINDRFGHGVGDEQLISLVQCVNSILNDEGTFARIGGEEFVILFVNHTRDHVMKTVETIRKALEDEAKVNKRRTTASFGISRFRDGYTSKDFFKEADKCLYSAKKMGRNCIVSN